MIGAAAYAIMLACTRIVPMISSEVPPLSRKKVTVSLAVCPVIGQPIEYV